MKTKVTTEERAFVATFSGAALDDEEIVAEAEKVPGPLGVRAKALREAREAFEVQLARIGFEHG